MAVNSFPLSQPVGTQTYGPVPFADNLTYVLVSLANWLSTNTIAFDIDVSIDGGPFVTRASQNPTPGNRNIGRNGTRDCSVGVSLPAGINRQIRAVVTVAGGPISTQVTITTS